KLTAYDDQLSECEMRAYGDRSAYVVLTEGAGTDREEFIRNAEALSPVFDGGSATLFINGEKFIVFTPSDDTTQYI
ncbi:MAG: hypothetical protein ACI4NM_09815, partial [Bullifex sp.]